MTKVNRKDEDLERVALHALGALDVEDGAALELQLRDDAELRDELDRMREVATELALSVRPLPPRSEVRDQLLERIAAEKPAGSSALPAHFFARERELRWTELSPGVEAKLLTPGVGVGGRALLLRVAPGAIVTEHEHRVAEHCYVLSGDVRLLGETLGPGDYHLAAAGTRHPNFTSDNGCLLLIVDGPPP